MPHKTECIPYSKLINCNMPAPKLDAVFAAHNISTAVASALALAGIQYFYFEELNFFELAVQTASVFVAEFILPFIEDGLPASLKTHLDTLIRPALVGAVMVAFSAAGISETNQSYMQTFLSSASSYVAARAIAPIVTDPFLNPAPAQT